MAATEKLTESHIILLAVVLCSESKLGALRALRAAHSNVLSPELIYRIILTFLPEETDPPSYVPLLKDLLKGSEDNLVEIDTSPIHELSEAAASTRVTQLRLQKVSPSDASHTSNGTPLFVRFVLQRAHQIDVATSDIPAILQLVEPFIDDFEVLQKWLVSRLVPLLRKDYEYYPDNTARLSLQDIEGLEGSAGIDILLQHSKEASAFIGRDLRGLVGPWKYGGNTAKRRKVSHAIIPQVEKKAEVVDQWSDWQDVNDWILWTSQVDHALASRAIADWDGPRDTDLGDYATEVADAFGQKLTEGYGQAALATIYAAENATEEVVEDCWRTLSRVAELSRIERPFTSDTSSLPIIPHLPQTFVGSSRAALLHHVLLRPGNALTLPSIDSLNFLTGVCCSLRVLHALQSTLSPRAAIEMCLFDNEQRQKQELQRVLQQTTRSKGDSADWRSIRDQLHWLRLWTNQPANATDGFSQRALFGRIDTEYLETTFLGTLLTSGQYQIVIDIYLKDHTSTLDLEKVEACVQESTLSSYDNASNGNRNRGGMKRASDTLRAFQPYFPKTSPIHTLDYLIAATHALSFYHLTLQHGVPFQPVSIRVHQDPLSLLEKVLEQNSSAYTKLDDLLSIGRNLVAARLPTPSKSPSHSADPETIESKTFDAEHRITYLAITSALSSNDFDTAYSYILTRSSPSSTPKATSFVDDTSWRAAYAAGRHHSPSTPQSLPSRIVNLSKRMELLSLALTLAPTAEPLSEILATWRRCEEEMNSLRAQEAQQEHAWDERGDELVPGGFETDGRDVDMADTRREREKRASSRRTAGYEDEAPMGLFDVARGAARAIGKSAFPLRQGQQPGTVRNQDTGIDGEHEMGPDGQRVRKRDVVSNMVTGGLKSGLGWMLGAQPVNEE